MNEIKNISDQKPALYQPQTVKLEQAKAQAVIEFAARVQDWPKLEEAVDLKIEDQKEFIGR